VRGSPGPVALGAPGNPFDMALNGLGAVELRFQRVCSLAWGGARLWRPWPRPFWWAACRRVWAASPGFCRGNSDSGVPATSSAQASARPPRWSPGCQGAV